MSSVFVESPSHTQVGAIQQEAAMRALLVAAFAAALAAVNPFPAEAWKETTIPLADPATGFTANGPIFYGPAIGRFCLTRTGGCSFSVRAVVGVVPEGCGTTFVRDLADLRQGYYFTPCR